MTLSSTQLKEMDSTVSLLEQWFREASTLHAGTWYFPGIGSGASVTDALRVARNSLDYLKGDLRLEVGMGLKPYSTWTNLAHATRDNLATVLKNVPSLSFSGVSANLAEGVRDAAKFTLVGTSVILVAVLGLFIVAGLRR